MNAEKIIDGLRYCDESAGLCIGCPLDMDFKDDKYCNIRLEAADLIESLLAQQKRRCGMTAQEIVQGLRYEQKKRKNDFVGTCETDISAMCKDAADLIEPLQAQLAESQRKERAARLEVCRHCPDGEIIDGVKHYSCDGCKWRGPEDGE